MTLGVHRGVALTDRVRLLMGGVFRQCGCSGTRAKLARAQADTKLGPPGE
jgi:hypothetical protein